MILKQTEDKNTTINKIYFIASIELDNQKHVYFGGELWKIMRVENGEMNRKGGPETFDNYLILCFVSISW